ncbi:alkene reductase [Kutzneria chonburiensis]|uniref:Alkene reductase n=1 Tax=Kutzneria chonburiensis TaxID=1483604 RepID=A0ABV6MN39_9PSEU|nr:alkene reductase [Kutzneria chonburiensis]
MPSPFEPVTVGGLTLPHRIAMSPMTRSRAYGQLPSDLMAEYYAQRAGAAMIITEGTQPSAVGQGYLNTPGIHSAEQIAAWRKVTDAVHSRGGRIFLQLMHTGRVGHPSFLPEGLQHVGPSAVAADSQVFTGDGMQAMSDPAELSDEDIAATVEDYAKAAANAVEAGFDGVELHGANGYLIHQFLSSNANRRTDRWGGSPENRVRFAVEVARAVADRIGPDRVGLRVSPGVTNNDIREDDPHDTYAALSDGIRPLGLAYLHVFEGPHRDITLRLRKEFDGTFILNPFTPGSHTGPAELALLEDGTADILTFGANYLANPDLPERLAKGRPLNTPDPATFYGGDEKGYTDYPRHAD